MDHNCVAYDELFGARDVGQELPRVPFPLVEKFVFLMEVMGELTSSFIRRMEPPSFRILVTDVLSNERSQLLESCRVMNENVTATNEDVAVDPGR